MYQVEGDGVGVGCSKLHRVTLHGISLEHACGGPSAKFLMSFDQRENVLSKGTKLFGAACESAVNWRAVFPALECLWGCVATKASRGDLLSPHVRAQASRFGAQLLLRGRVTASLWVSLRNL